MEGYAGRAPNRNADAVKQDRKGPAVTIQDANGSVVIWLRHHRGLLRGRGKLVRSHKLDLRIVKVEAPAPISEQQSLPLVALKNSPG
jgi:hypothetical protein